MSKLHLNHLKVRLNDLYTSKIDLSDVNERPSEEIESYFLTRSFAVYTLQVLGGVEEDKAISSIVDGFDDNGIDLIHFDSKNKNLWLIQSKFTKNTTGEPENGDLLKFKTGILDLIDLKLSRFNSKVQSKEDEIISALNDPLVKIRIVLAHTGRDGLSEHNERTKNDLLQDLNDPSELAKFEVFALKHAHKSLVGGLDGEPIKAELALTNWGFIEEPYKAFYGQINAINLAELWSEHRGRLFSDNIRDFIGFSEVNEDIIETIKEEPENFYYFNNGITALCKSIDKKAISGSDRNTGYFVAEDFKIVNGAQTVGSIGNALDSYRENVEKANLFIKIISLEHCPDEFGTRITKTTNTQNRIDKKDFVSLDPQQERIKTELALEGITYHFKRSNKSIPSDGTNCSIEEATIALACLNNDVSLAVQAKREIGKLWDDITKKPYTDLFNASLSATQIWRSIQVLRKVTEFLRNKENETENRDKSHYIHSNRFVLHLVFSKMDNQLIFNPSSDFDSYLQNDITVIIADLSEKSKTFVDFLYPNSLIHQVYRNFTKCRELKDKILE